MSCESSLPSFEHTRQATHHRSCGCCTGCTCICRVVKAIKHIQDHPKENCEPCTSCCLKPMGYLDGCGRRDADTRVFTLTNKNGDLFKALFIGKHGKCVSVFFRAEKIFDNCCAKLRVLVPLKKDGQTVVDILTPNGNVDLAALCEVKDWGRSNSCITVDLHCFCAVQCIADVDLNLCD